MDFGYLYMMNKFPVDTQTSTAGDVLNAGNRLHIQTSLPDMTNFVISQCDRPLIGSL